MDGNGQKPTVGDRVASQFSLVNIWNRLGRVVIVALGAIITLGREPKTLVEWCGFGLAIAGAIWTGDVKEK